MAICAVRSHLQRGSSHRPASTRSSAAFVIVEPFAIGTVTRPPEGGGAPVVERAVLAAPGQLVELLPGWAPLAS